MTTNDGADRRRSAARLPHHHSARAGGRRSNGGDPHPGVGRPPGVVLRRAVRRDLALFTLPQGLQYLVKIYNPQVGGQGEFHLVMAASVLITLPMILIFFIAQRYFIEGIATTGSKG